MCETDRSIFEKRAIKFSCQGDKGGKKNFCDTFFYASFRRICREIKGMWDTHWLTNMGPKHEELRKQLKEYLDVQQIELFTNGHMALELTLQAMNLQEEVKYYNAIYFCIYYTCDCKKWTNSCFL